METQIWAMISVHPTKQRQTNRKYVNKCLSYDLKKGNNNNTVLSLSKWLK